MGRECVTYIIVHYDEFAPGWSRWRAFEKLTSFLEQKLKRELSEDEYIELKREFCRKGLEAVEKLAKDKYGIAVSLVLHPGIPVQQEYVETECRD
jgi:hypothetical protein